MNTSPVLSSVDSGLPIYSEPRSSDVVRLLSGRQPALVTFNSARVDRLRFDARQSHLAPSLLVMRIAELPSREVQPGLSIYGALPPLAVDVDEEVYAHAGTEDRRPLIAAKIAAISTLIIVSGLFIGWILEHFPQK